MPPSKAATSTNDNFPAAPTLPPWREFFDIHSFSFPVSLHDTKTRTKRNFTHFEINYLNVFVVIYSLHLYYLCYTMFSAILYYGNAEKSQHADSSISSKGSIIYFASIAVGLSAALYVKNRTPINLVLIISLTLSTFAQINAWLPMLSYVVISVSIIFLHAVLRVPTFEPDGLLDDQPLLGADV